MKKGNYKDCLKFIQNELHINLLNFQKEIIRSFFENRSMIIPRGCGKTTCINAYSKYIKHINSTFIDEIHPDEAYISNKKD
jgi:reverse gyrase